MMLMMMMMMMSVCLSVSLSVRKHISRTTRPIRSSPNFLCMSVAQSSCGSVTSGFTDVVIFAHNGHICAWDQPSSQPDGAARRLGRRPLLKL